MLGPWVFQQELSVTVIEVIYYDVRQLRSDSYMQGACYGQGMKTSKEMKAETL